MKKRRGKFSDKQIGRLKLVDDFLPKSKNLILKITYYFPGSCTASFPSRETCLTQTRVEDP